MQQCWVQQSTYTVQQSCMQQCCFQLCCMENSTYTMQQSCRQQLHATSLHRVWLPLQLYIEFLQSSCYLKPIFLFV